MTLRFQAMGQQQSGSGLCRQQGHASVHARDQCQPSDPNYIQALANQNISVTATIADPLGRTNSSGPSDHRAAGKPGKQIPGLQLALYALRFVRQQHPARRLRQFQSPQPAKGCSSPRTIRSASRSTTPATPARIKARSPPKAFRARQASAVRAASIARYPRSISATPSMRRCSTTCRSAGAGAF